MCQRFSFTDTAQKTRSCRSALGILLGQIAIDDETYFINLVSCDPVRDGSVAEAKLTHMLSKYAERMDRLYGIKLPRKNREK